MPGRRPSWTWWADVTKPRGIVTGPGGAVEIEYLRTSRVLRFHAPSDGTACAVEMPLAEFVAGLGLEAADLMSTRQYLLFGGAGGGAGGLRDLVGAFNAEATAKDAFRSLRLSPDFRGGWSATSSAQPPRKSGESRRLRKASFAVASALNAPTRSRSPPAPPPAPPNSRYWRVDIRSAASRPRPATNSANGISTAPAVPSEGARNRMTRDVRR